jgi:hypothetical protein
MEPIIRIVDMVKKFQTKNNVLTALDGINLDIERGEIFGIIGLSGAGKSTLVRCINYLEVPSAGSVIFEGKDLTKMKEKDIRKTRQEMGMIFQSFNLLSQRNIIDNICFPLEIAGVKREEALQKARELLKLVGLSEKEKDYPSMLSGGQKQRVAIARAIATNPKVLLCDEATSALDPNTTKQILELIKDINKKFKITVIVITHEMKVIESVCDRVAIIDNAKIAECGKVSDIFADPKSDIGRQLILGEANENLRIEGGRKLRIIFDGRSSFEPVIANLIFSTKVPVNILYAKTNDLQGSAHGQMIIQLPDNEMDYNKVYNYLMSKKVTFEEVE